MLAVCRSLHQAGYDVTATSFTALAPARWSRACTRWLRITDALEDTVQFAEQLADELARHSYVTLIAGSDSSLLAISRERGRLQALTNLGLPPPDVVERALHRESLAAAAQQAGLTPAVSIHCKDVGQALDAARKLGFPVVLKSPEGAGTSDNGVLNAPKGRAVATEANLVEAASEFHGEHLVQRWVEGDIISFGGVIADGRLLGAAVSRYWRMWPTRSGSVTFSETVPVSPKLEDMVRRLLVAIDWEGIFEVELIQSGPEEFVPIDLNPRPYGSMALAVAAGAPLAAIWCDWLLGRDPRPVQALAGYRYRWEDGDLRHLLWQLRHGNYRASAATTLPRRHVTHAHAQLADPLPLLARGLRLASKSTQRTARPRS